MRGRSTGAWRRRSVAALAALALGGAATLTACGDSGTGADGDSVVLGAVVPLTGPLASYGKDLREGYQLAVDELNESGGAGGRKLELKVEDDTGDPAAANTATRKLITRERVAAILGSYGSDPSIASATVAEQFEVPNLQPFASAPAIVSAGRRYLFNTISLITQTQRVEAEFLRAVVKPKTAAVVYIDNPFGESGAQATVDSLKAGGVEIVGKQRIAAAQSSYSAALNKIKRARPEALLFLAYGPEATVLIKEMRQLDITPRAVMWNQGVLLDPGIKDALGANLDHMMGSPEWFPGVPIPTADKVAASYEKRHHRAPDYAVMKGYQAVQIIAQAVRQAGGTDKEKLRAALAKGRFETVLGAVRFDRRGQAAAPIFVFQMQGDRFNTVWPQDAARSRWLPFQPWSRR